MNSVYQISEKQLNDVHSKCSDLRGLADFLYYSKSEEIAAADTDPLPCIANVFQCVLNQVMDIVETVREKHHS